MKGGKTRGKQPLLSPRRMAGNDSKRWLLRAEAADDLADELASKFIFHAAASQPTESGSGPRARTSRPRAGTRSHTPRAGKCSVPPLSSSSELPLRWREVRPPTRSEAARNRRCVVTRRLGAWDTREEEEGGIAMLVNTSFNTTEGAADFEPGGGGVPLLTQPTRAHGGILPFEKQSRSSLSSPRRAYYTHEPLPSRPRAEPVQPETSIAGVSRSCGEARVRASITPSRKQGTMAGISFTRRRIDCSALSRRTFQRRYRKPHRAQRKWCRGIFFDVVACSGPLYTRSRG